MPLTDHDIRKLSTILWRDIVKWAAGTEVERSFGLFKADHQTPKMFGGESTEPIIARGLEPGTPLAEWAFIPASDLFLVVGEGIIGTTVEGVFGDTPIGRKPLKLHQCLKRTMSRQSHGSSTQRRSRREVRKSDHRSRPRGDGRSSRSPETSSRHQEQSKASKWDVQS